MKLYDCTTAPSPRRVRIFLAEKGISVPTVQVDLRNGEQFSPAFQSDQSRMHCASADILAICRYFRSSIQIRRFGRTAEQKAVIEA